jgi:hypothetical protein
MGAYGRYARGSCLADYLELVALQGREAASATSLETALRQAGWWNTPRGLFTVNPDINTSEDPEDAEGLEDPEDPDWPDWTFNILREREQVLGAEYPFRVEDRELRLQTRTSSHAAYLQLLATTTAHAYGASTASDPRQVFELMIVSALSRMGLRATGMGTATTRGRQFPQELLEAGTRIGLKPSLDPRPRKSRAKDAGVDAIATADWADDRTGQLTFVLQATLAKSEEWERKINEPRPDLWVGYLNERYHPIAALAVPHHIEREHLTHLVRDKATALDRLRLTRLINIDIKGARELTDWMSSCEVALL